MAWKKYSDPWDGDGGESAPRPSRSVRLVDQLEGEKSPRVTRISREAPAPRDTKAIRGGDDDLPWAEDTEVDSFSDIGFDGMEASHGGSLPGSKSASPKSKPKSPSQSTPAASPAEEDPLQAAIRAGLNLLGFGDRPARRLLSELKAKGFDGEVAQAAVERIVAMGYIREGSAAESRIRQNLRKGWGARRIREDLRARGYSPEVIEEATAAALAEVDPAEACAAVIAKKYGGVPADQGERRKMTAALLRLGYESGEIREAMRLLRRGE